MVDTSDEDYKDKATTNEQNNSGSEKMGSEQSSVTSDVLSDYMSTTQEQTSAQESKQGEKTKEPQTIETDEMKNVPWEGVNREDKQVSEGGFETQESTTDQGDHQTFGHIDWEFREVGNHYPLEKGYHCNECLDAHFAKVAELKRHVTNTHKESWAEYLQESPIHRCPSCSKPLSSIEKLYCDECQYNPNDRIPCQNCGLIRVNIDDPFCSSSCAAERMQAVNTPPLKPPTNADKEWLNNPHRLPNGIPTAAPFIGNHDLTCRECFEYGSDDIHRIAVHVAERHPDLGWGGYIKKYELRRCRVCETPLNSLLPLYCSEDCQQSDPDPPRICNKEGCENAVERRQKYCTRNCYLDDRFERNGEQETTK